jgi:hypothetical protein
VEKIKIDYKGFEIEFSEHSDEWSCKGAGVKPGQSVDKIKAKIDELIKVERSFPRQKILCRPDSWYGDDTSKSFVERDVTSECADDPDHYWTVSAKGKRGKKPGKMLFLDCPENREKIREIEALDAEMKKLKDNREAIAASLILFTPTK